MRIYLVGFMSSGKTTLGKAVADRLHVPFIDTDERIASREQASVMDIFTDKGEWYFRDLETDALKETLLFDKALIATGGGLPCFHNHIDWMLQHGISIYLEWSWERLYHMLQRETAKRPLLSETRSEADWKKIEAIFHQRRAFYEQAAMTIEMTDDLNRNIEMLMTACNYIWK